MRQAVLSRDPCCRNASAELAGERACFSPRPAVASRQIFTVRTRLPRRRNISLPLIRGKPTAFQLQ
jgi:hypothetical protein